MQSRSSWTRNRRQGHPNLKLRLLSMMCASYLVLPSPHGEWSRNTLVAYPKGAPQRWYHRTFNEDTEKYDWSKPSIAFKQDKSLQDKTRENSLFLSVGPQFNHTQLTRVFNWFKNGLYFYVLERRKRFASPLYGRFDHQPELPRPNNQSLSSTSSVRQEWCLWGGVTAFGPGQEEFSAGFGLTRECDRFVTQS